LVTGFEGSVNNGRIPDVGEKVKFLPSHCRMQQVHSGVIVHSEGSKLRIEGIDLKFGDNAQIKRAQTKPLQSEAIAEVFNSFRPSKIVSSRIFGREVELRLCHVLEADCQLYKFQFSAFCR
jgi:hypothetical protein